MFFLEPKRLCTAFAGWPTVGSVPRFACRALRHHCSVYPATLQMRNSHQVRKGKKPQKVYCSMRDQMTSQGKGAIVRNRHGGRVPASLTPSNWPLGPTCRKYMPRSPTRMSRTRRWFTVRLKKWNGQLRPCVALTLRKVCSETL